jgi:hypothetical protein
LNGLFDIDDTKDSDTTNTHGKEKPEEVTQEQKPKEKTPRERLIAKLKEMGINVTDYAKEKGLSGQVPDSRFEELLKELG